MHLDMITMSAVNITVTAILGGVLVFTWARERSSPFVGWWGFALLVQSAGIVIAAIASLLNNGDLVTVGSASMIFAEAIKWRAARRFEHRPILPLLVLAGPFAYLAAAHSGYFPSFDGRVILSCAFISTYSIATATELAFGHKERLKSRAPAVVLLLATGAGYLSWLPLILTRPIREAALVFASSWFAPLILATMLVRIALAFLVLAMAKERAELKQRTGALTDPLTGLPNRRALFEAADALGQRGRSLKGDPISVLLFDLDHFKQTNDSFGHQVGDYVLKVFAATLSQHLEGHSIVARVGGEEFAAILPGADPATAAEAAEAVRSAFATSAAMVDGVAVGGTVSVGAASDVDIDCDLNSLFRRADAALYAAKHAGRNRVELVGPEDAIDLEARKGPVRTSRSGREADTTVEYDAA